MHIVTLKKREDRPATIEEHKALRDHLRRALNEWRLYAEITGDRDLDHEDSAEALAYRAALETLNA